MESKKESDMFRIEWCDRPIVRVLGTVMTRDDNLGGWVPYLNGGQSKVGIHESVDGRRFRIYGWRISDKKVTLDCLIQRNMVFHETIGTFHHWKVGDKKMGLTFYTPAEARSFNRGVRVALEKLSRIAEYNSSSGSSSCSRLSDDHQSSCTSPASSTESSSPYEIGASTSQRVVENRKKLSTSSTSSSSSSKHATRSRRSPSRRPGKQSHGVYSSTSSSISTQNRISHTHQPAITPVITAAPNLSLLSSATSPHFCETPSSDLGQPHFRWPLPQQQAYSTNLTFLNRPIAKEGSPYELSALSQQPATHFALPVSREADMTSITKPKVNFNTLPVIFLNIPSFLAIASSLSIQALLPENVRPEQGDAAKVYDTAIQLHRDPRVHQRGSPHSRDRENSHSYRRQGRGHHSTRPRLTKTPHLDILERQRDLKPTEPNSYVLFSSSKPATTLGSRRIGSRCLTAGVTTALGGIRSGEYKPLGQMSLGYPYHPMLSTMHTASYHPPQSGTLSIMASTADAPQLYSRSEMFYTSNIDCIKDDAICYEQGSSLISSSPKKSKHKRDYFGDSMSDIAHPKHSEGYLCCCLCYCPFRSRQQTTRLSRYKEDLAERSKCRHCHEMFNHELNKPGSCRHAPDRCLDTINRVTCMFCVNSLFYHCCRDDEGDYDDDPCSCSNGRGGGRSKLFSRWSALAALSIIFPCLCLYPPLRACHGCGVACHCCGGKHQAPSSSTKHTEKKQQQQPQQ